jgi:hypothetical protein
MDSNGSLMRNKGVGDMLLEALVSRGVEEGRRRTHSVVRETCSLDGRKYEHRLKSL